MERQDEILLQKRLLDLSRIAGKREIITFSNFLNLNELNLFHQISSDLDTSCQLFGGYEQAERQMIAFIPDALSYARADIDFPIVCLHFCPGNPRFAEELSHRDVLGALMNAGVERSRIGDIKIDGKNAYVFCEEGISGYLLQSIQQIRHTAVAGRPAAPGSYQIRQEFAPLNGIAASVRLDNVVAFAINKSRSQAVSLIHAQKVFINARIAASKSYECKSGDVISIRGFGKYIFEGSDGETKKGRIKIALKKYI